MAANRICKVLKVNQDNERLMEEYERLASDVSVSSKLFFELNEFYLLNHLIKISVAGVDPSHAAVAGEPPVGQLSGGGAEEAGGVPRVPAQAQAAARRAEGQAGDQLQHPPGTIPISYLAFSYYVWLCELTPREHRESRGGILTTKCRICRLAQPCNFIPFHKQYRGRHR